MLFQKKANKEAYATYHFLCFVSKLPMGRLSSTSVLASFAISIRKSKVYVHDTTLRSQNAEQLRENGWLRCSRKPQSFKTYDSSEFGVWSSYTVREAYKPLNLRKTTLRTLIAICLLDRYGNTVKHNFDVSHCNARVAKLKSG